MKEINKSLANEFHTWQRDNLSGKFVIQDIDTWPIIVSNAANNYEPVCLIELKRSYSEPSDWTPFKEDLPNYMAIFKLALKASVPLVIIYFKKGKNLSELDATISIFKVKNVNNLREPWIDYSKIVISTMDFKKQFPDILVN